MKRSTNRILTSHVGSLVRPPEIAALFPDRPAGKPFDANERRVLDKTINEVLKQQVDAGIDIPSDGEFSKSGFAGYIVDRLTGFEPKQGSAPFQRGRDRIRFADAYADIDSAGSSGRSGVGAQQNIVCAGPVKFVGEALVREDIDRLKAAMQAAGVEEAFVPATAPGTIELQRPNEY
ncbi:MAG TPA: hypothetical protein VI876_07165, partial [Dehalococcoidia bacterium]|nr:hypothetical protein [Dehalococcoidia bacterium]